MSRHFDERRPPITPQLAVRVAVLGGLAFALFAIVFLRLWFLQVLSSARPRHRHPPTLEDDGREEERISHGRSDPLVAGKPLVGVEIGALGA